MDFHLELEISGHFLSGKDATCDGKRQSSAHVLYVLKATLFVTCRKQIHVTFLKIRF